MQARKIIITENQLIRLMNNMHDHSRGAGTSFPRKLPIPKGWVLVGRDVYEDGEGNLFVLFSDGRFQLVEDY